MAKGMKGISRLFDGCRLVGCMVVLLMGLFFLSLEGCSSSKSGGSEAQGELIIGITDDEGEFLSYTVNVASIELTKANGAKVDVLPIDTTIDFAQYVDMTEFLTAATIPSGVYTRAALTLDYRNADIWVEGPDGEAVQVPAGSILDEDGNPITTMEFSVSLEGKDSLLIAPGIPASLDLDFDLAASNKVTFNGDGSLTLNVSPVLQASVNVDIPKIHRVRGPLERDSVDVAAEKFQVIIRPFVHAMSHDHRFGALTVHTTSQTIYEIDGVSYQGEEGLRKLSEMPAYTAVIAEGSLSHQPIRFEAQEVYAGSSVPGGQMDVVRGNVVSRSGNTLMVKGAILIRKGGSVVFNDTVTVELGEGTKVRRQLLNESSSINDISVGQRIWAFGTISEDGDDLILDATSGYIRMMLTTLRGIVNSQALGAVEIDLQSIDGRNVDLFDFSGTGADPTQYQIDIGTLTPSLDEGMPVKLRGFVTPFGHGADVKDFEARTIVNLADIPAVMHVAWFPPSPDAIQDLGADGFSLDLSGHGLFHHVAQGWVVTDLTTLAEAPVIEPDSGGIYFIGQGETWQLFTTFESFAASLQERLSDGESAQRLIAKGSFDRDTDTLSASFIVIWMG